MKKQSFKSAMAFTLIVGSLTLSSCTKLGKNLQFTLPMQTGNVNLTIPVTNASSGTLTFGPVANYYNVDSFIKASTANQLGVSNITSVKLTSCTITINNATSANNFANFSSCSASFSSNTDTSPYTLDISNNPNTFSGTINLPVDTSQNLSSYLGDQFNYSVSGALRSSITIPLNCTISYAFNVVVQG
jgi:hypothetical protein